ncbi:MAG: hypothetical protein PVH17_08180 [Anaerolineae bacterium]
MVDSKADRERSVDSLPYLTPNSAESCPVPMADVLAFLQRETISGESLRVSDLEFVRTARVVDYQYWLWRFFDEGEIECFVHASVGPDGQGEIGYDDNFLDYTPEEYIFSDYLGVL